TPKGGRRGDQFVKLRILLPESGGEALAGFLKGWEPEDYDPRKKLKLD
ncbi:MAG: J domain-containing protein, partial [Proteobacteria bacterium]|nr:J domain-containing protein [Pseudomonadota bacterium]